MKNGLWLLAVVVFFYSCSSNFSVKGKIEGMPVQKFKVEELAFDANIPIDSGRTTDKGEFSFSHGAKEEGLYRIKFEQGKYILLALNNKDQAEIKGQWTTLEDYVVNGSNSSTALKGFLVNLRENIKDIKTLSVILDSIKIKNESDSMKTMAEQDLKDVNDRFMVYIKKFADTTQSVASALFAVNMINPQFEGPYVKSFYESIQKRFPKSTAATQFASRFLGSKADKEEEIATPTVGSVAPDFSASSPQGSEISLSSLKGKYVLVDFWASWCGPCRKENPAVVMAYARFKDKNFDILGVSLDSNKEKWIEAINQDKLAWKHVSELRGWQSVIARNYQVNSIPTNFLVDPTGNIIAIGLRGDALVKKLEEVLK